MGFPASHVWLSGCHFDIFGPVGTLEVGERAPSDWKTTAKHAENNSNLWRQMGLLWFTMVYDSHVSNTFHSCHLRLAKYPTKIHDFVSPFSWWSGCLPWPRYNPTIAMFHGQNDDKPLLVGGWPTPLKNMSSSNGIIVPNWMEKWILMYRDLLSNRPMITQMLANTRAHCNSISVSGIMNGRLLQRVSNNSVQDRHDIPQVLSSTNIYLLGSHSSTRRNGNLHSEAAPQTLVMEIWPPASLEHTGLCGLHKTGDSACPILNQTQRKPCHKIDVSTCVLAENLTFPPQKSDLYVIESMVSVEVGRSPYDHPSGTDSRMTKKYSMLVEHQYPRFFFVNITFKKTKS